MSSRSRSKKSKRSPKIGETKESKKGLWIFLSVFVGLVLITWLVDRAKVHNETSKEKEVPKQETFDDLLTSNDLPKIKNVLQTMEREYNAPATSFPLKIENLERRVLVNERFIQLAKTDSESAWGIKNRIKLILLLESHAVDQKSGRTKYYDELVKTLETSQDTPNEELQIELAIANLLLPMLDALRDENAELDDRLLSKKLGKVLEDHPNDIELALRIRKMTVFLKRGRARRKAYLTALKLISDRYLTNSNAKIREVGFACKSELVAENYRLGELEKSFEPSKIANKELHAVIVKILNEEMSNPVLWNRLLKSCGVLEDKLAFDLAIDGYTKIKESAQGATGHYSEQIAELANNGLVRCNAYEKKILLDFHDHAGKIYKPSYFDGKPTLAVFLSEHDPDFAKYIVTLKELESFRNRRGLRIIVVLINTDARALVNIIEESTSYIFVPDPNMDSSITQSFPVERPTFLFLDGEQKLVETTRNRSEVKPRTESLIFKVGLNP